MWSLTLVSRPVTFDAAVARVDVDPALRALDGDRSVAGVRMSSPPTSEARMLPSPVRSSSRPLTRSIVIAPSPLRAMMLTSRGTDTMSRALADLMETEAAERFRPGPLHFELDAVAFLRALDLQAVDGLTRRAALLDLDGDVGLVPGLNLDRRRRRWSGADRRAGHLEALLLADDLPLRIDADDASGGQGGDGQKRRRHKDG